jgi:uncharacterized protein YgbK (DUF1537 family)
MTGATDLATNLVERGIKTVLLLQPFRADGTVDSDGVLPQRIDGAEAVVVALKSRNAPVSVALAQSLAAVDYLRQLGAGRFYIKYCSTFDSTARGNIGPVIDAVLERLGESITIVVPSFPDAGRTVYQGHLFVGGDLLSDSPMRFHPLNPMSDSSLLRLLGAQTQHAVALIDLATVRSGPAAVAQALNRLRAQGPVSVVVDAIDRSDLVTIMRAGESLRLVTGGSGLALGLPSRPNAEARSIPVVPGRRFILCGSASAQTRAQIAWAQPRLPALKLDLEALARNFDTTVAIMASWAEQRWRQDPAAVPLIHSVKELDDVVDYRAAAELVERAMGALARSLVAGGGRQFIVAGGETSGRVMADLGVRRLRIGQAIAPGVAWSVATTDRDDQFNVALKSGNFGDVDMFTQAWSLLREGGPV